MEPDCQLGRYYTKGRSKVLFHDKEICDLYKSSLSEVDGSFADVKKCAAFEGILDNLDKKIIAKEKESELRFYIQSSERKSLSGFGQLADRCIRMETSYPSTLDNNKGVLSSFRDNYLKRETSTRTPNAKPSEVTR